MVGFLNEWRQRKSEQTPLQGLREVLVEMEQRLSKAVDELREAIMEIDRRDPEVIAETARVANIEPLPELEMVPMPVDFPGFVTVPGGGLSVPVSPEEEEPWSEGPSAAEADELLGKPHYTAAKP
jgi:hypothetical protein